MSFAIVHAVLLFVGAVCVLFAQVPDFIVAFPAFHREFGENLDEGRAPAHFLGQDAVPREWSAVNNAGDDDSAKNISVEAHRNATDLGQCQELGQVAPYYWIMVASAIKMMVTLLLFGPPQVVSKRELPHAGWPTIKASFKQLGKLLCKQTFMALSFWKAYMDVGDIGDVWSQDVGVVSKLTCSIEILMTSANLVTTCSLIGVNKLYIHAYKWREAHSEDFVPSEEQSILSSSAAFFFFVTPDALTLQGPLFVTQHVVLSFLYGIPAYILLLPLWLAGFVVYCWIIIPVYLIFGMMAGLLGFSSYGCWQSGDEPLCLPEIESARIKPLAEEASQLLALKHIESGFLDGRGGMRGGLSTSSAYEHEWEAFLQTGTTSTAWAAYFQSSLLIYCVIQVLVTTMLRLLTGTPYLEAIFLTLGERHMSDYIRFSLRSLKGHLGFAASVL